MSDTVTITAVEILKPGTYVDANGKVVTVTRGDLCELAAEYDPALREAPAVVGHPKMDDPAYGWMRNLRVDGEVLLCDLDDVDPEFADILKAGRYKNRSLSFYRPGTQGNPKPGKHYPKHLGLLGARAPAVPGLKPIQFAADDDATVITLAAPSWGWRLPWALRSIAGTFQRLREQTIAASGIDAADQTIPAYVSADLQQAAAEIEASAAEDNESDDCGQPSQFATPLSNSTGGSMATPEDLTAREAALASREADLAARERDIKGKEVVLAAAEAEARSKADVAFVAALIEDGRLPPGERDSVLAELAGLDDGAPTIELAAGDGGQPVKITQLQAYRARLGKMPKMVQRGEFDTGKRDPGAVEFAAPAGYTVSPVSLDIHNKASAYQRAHPGTDYSTALAAVLA